MPSWEFHHASLVGFPLTAFPVRQEPIELHQHWGYAELVIITGGKGKHLLEGECFEVTRGDVFVIPKNRLHGYSDCEALELINVLFDPERLLLPEHQLRQMPGYHALFALEPEVRARHDFESRLRLDEAPLRRVEHASTEIHSEVVGKKPGFEVAITGLFFGMLVELSRAYSRMSSPSSQALLRLSRLLEWIDRHFTEPLTVVELARRAHMSQSTLGRCFHECFGVSPLNYVIDLRLKKASQVLRDTEVPVKEVASMVGIDDPNYFARLYRRHTGVEPSAYRAQHRPPKQASL
ncbi:MAG: AraC family transcriptional regulator [Polyangiaceae bacterium]|nr:AraC family transcriptional regulator [Polyangiaceae bacterium]